MTLKERVFVLLQIRSESKGSSVDALAKELHEPAAFVRFALERLRKQGAVRRRGTGWSADRAVQIGSD